MRVFISYGRDEHIELARRLKDDLKARGHEVWFDEDCLKPGFDWEYYIEEGLQWCATEPKDGRVVLLMTPHAIRRPDGYCLNELARALYRGLLVVPVMVVWCEPPLSICRIQWLDMTDCVPVAENLERFGLKRDRLIQALEEGNLDFEATQSSFYYHLQPLDFSADIAQHVQNFVGRKWIFERIDAWINNPNSSRIFWIIGSPGVGKTAIASYLCHKRREVVAFHLCRHGHDDKSDPKRCVLSLAYQFSSQFPEYREHIALLLGDLNKSAATLFDNLIVQPLARRSHLPNYPMLIVIDGLDEATRHGRNELAEFIGKEFPRTPPWLRLLITSRPEPEVVQPLQGLSPYYLDAGSPENLNDIRIYLQKNLSSSSPYIEPNQKIIDSIVEKSEGIFLYVETLINELKEERLTLDQLIEFPQGLGGVFFRFFTRQFPDILSYQQRYRPLLEMIVASRGPLPLKLARDALGWSSYDYNVNEKGEVGGEILSSLGSLFPYTADYIRPFHQSIIDWLTNPAKAGPFFVDIKTGHKLLAEACWKEYKKGVDRMSSYSFLHLPTHLMETERWDDLLELIKDSKVGLITRWIEGGEGEKGLPILMRLISYLEEKNREPETVAGLATQVARIYMLWAEYEEAEKWLCRSLMKTSFLRGRRIRAVALHELGSLELYKHNFQESIRYYSRALKLCRWGIPVYRDEAAANLIGLATVFRERYLFREAIRMAKKALQEAKKAGDIRHIIATERLLGSAYKSLGNYDEADLHIKAGTLLADTYSIPLEKLRLLLLMGWLEFDLAILNREIPSSAEKSFQMAIEEAHRMHDFYCLLEAKISLGCCALIRGETDEASNLFFPLKEMLPSDEHLELKVGIELGLACITHQKGELGAAADLYQQIISYCKEHDLRYGLTIALIGLGSVQWHTGRIKEARMSWNEALKTAEQISSARRLLAKIRIESCKADSRVTP